MKKIGTLAVEPLIAKLKEEYGPYHKQVRAIGQEIYKAGGKKLMLLVHSSFATKHFRMKRNLEMLWDGIGEWQG